MMKNSIVYLLALAAIGLIGLTRAFPIRIMPQNYNSFILEVGEHDTIDRLKRAIQRKDDIPVEQQRLMYNGLELEGGRSVGDYKIRRDATIFQLHRPLTGIEVFIQTNGRQLKTRFDPLDKIERVKKFIETKNNIVADKQYLYFSDQPLEDGHSLASYGIDDGSTIVQLFEPPKTSIPIAVQTSSGNTIDLEMEPTDTIKQVKQEIKKRERVASHLEQRLHFGAKELKSGKKQLQDYGIKAGSVLVQSLQPRKTSFKLEVKTSTGKTLSLELEPTDTIRRLKSLIETMEKIPSGEQRLHSADGVLLSADGNNDDLTLTACGISEGSTVVQSVRPSPPKTSIEIFVKTSKGITVGIDIEPTDSVATLKQAIESVTNVSADDQRLFLDDGSMLNEDIRTLNSYGIVKDSTILQVFHPKNALDLTIEASNGQVFTSFFLPSETIEQVKREIGKRSGIPLDQQILRLADGSQMTLDDDERTLESYGIKSGSSTTIVQTYVPKAELQIVVETSKGHLFVLNGKQSDQVEQIKREIERRDRIPFDEQQIVFAGQRLEDDRTLGSYNIGTGSTLFQALIPLDGFEVSIQTSQGHVFSVRVETNTTVEDIKQEIFKREQIQPDNQQLYSLGQELLDVYTLGAYKMRPGATIVQEMRKDLRITLESSFGNKWKFDVDPEELVDRVKVEIERHEDVPADRQRLMFDDEELEPGTRLSEYNINTGDTIKQLLHTEGQIIVFIKTSKHNMYLKKFQPKETIFQVKQLIFSHDSIPIEKQVITLDGAVLLDDKTLEYYGVETRATLVQHTRARGLSY